MEGPTDREAPAPTGTAAWIAADRELADLPAGPALVRLLVDLTEQGAESAWTKPALVSLFDNAGEVAAAERFFAEIRELALAARSIEVERRYAPWARTNAIADLPSATLELGEANAAPGAWLARWVAVGQRLGPRWGSVEPFLAEMVRERPLLAEEAEGTDAGPPGPGDFLDLLRATISVQPAAIEMGGPVGPADPELFRRYCREVPPGPVGWALRGRPIEFADGTRLEFLRFPRLGELTSRDGQGRLTFHLPPAGELPDLLAGPLGAYLARAEPALGAHALGFAAHCRRSLERLRERFAPRLVADALTHGLSPRAGGG